MRHIKENRITSITAASENANYPIENVLDTHPSKPWKAADGVSQAILTAEVNYGITDVAIFGTNAASATVTATDPNEMSWGDSDEWGTVIPAIDIINLVANGTFDTDTDWTKGTGWSIDGGVASCDGTQTSASFLSQVISDGAGGVSYLIYYTVSGYVAGGVRVFVDNSVSGTTRTANGTYGETLTETAGLGRILFRASPDFVGDIDNVIVYEVQDLGDSDTWANTTITTPSVTQFQRSTSEALWLQLADRINRPAELVITLTAPVGDTVYAGVIRSSIVETYAGTDPEHGTSIGGIDTSIESEMSNGSRYYKKRNVIRQIGFDVLMETDSAFDLIKFYQQYGKAETAWKLTDSSIDEWVIFGYIEPSVVFDHFGRTTVNIQFTEVL